MSRRKTEKEYKVRNIELEPLNENQRIYISAILHNAVTVAIGSAGTSKTYVPTTIAAQLFAQKKIERIVICRPTEGPGRYSGHVPGSEEEKLEVWVRPVAQTLKSHLGESHYEHSLKFGKIEYCDLHKIKGRNFDDTFIIVDEAEDLDVETIKSLVTRIGENSKMVINGDIKQKHIRKGSGLEYLIYLIDKYSLKIPLIEFTLEDCVRSDITKMFLEVFEREEDNETHNK